MQVPDERIDAKRAAQQKRLEEHLAWRRSFFESRPPPAFIPRHSRHKRPIGGGGAHTQELFAAAKSIAAKAAASEDAEAVAAAKRKREEDELELREKLRTRAERRQLVWRRQMMMEKQRRNPFTDLRVRSDPRRCVIVYRLPPRAVENDVREWAAQFGRVNHVSVVRDREGRSRKYAFVEFGLTAEAHNAVRSCGGTVEGGGRGPFGRSGAAPARIRILGARVGCAMELGRSMMHYGRSSSEQRFLPKRIRAAMELMDSEESLNAPFLAKNHDDDKKDEDADSKAAGAAGGAAHSTRDALGESTTSRFGFFDGSASIQNEQGFPPLQSAKIFEGGDSDSPSTALKVTDSSDGGGKENLKSSALDDLLDELDMF